MDLRTGEPYWVDQGRRQAITLPPLDRTARCDVVIVGAGITGALIADMLAGEGGDVIVIDKRDVGMGSTAASTALLMYEIDMPLVELAERYGPERAARCYQASLRSQRTLATLAAELDDRCEFTPRKSLYLASRRSHARSLPAECEARRRAGIEVDLLSKADLERLFSFSAPAALLSHEAAQADPLRLTRALLRRAMLRGARTFSRTCVTGIHGQPGLMELSTSNGQTIRAKSIVIAAGYETGSFLDKPPGSLHSTYVICSRPMQPSPPWHEGWMMWETSRPYAYLRTTADGRAIIGGADVPFKNVTARDALLPRRARTLHKRFAKMFPDLTFETEYAWTGTFGDSDDGLPYVGPHPSLPGCLLAMGFGGNGITWGVLAAEIIRDSFLQRDNPDAALFAFDRAERD